MTQMAAPPVLVSDGVDVERRVEHGPSAASTIGKYSGRHPAITALTASFSAVTPLRRAGTAPTTSSPLALDRGEHRADALRRRRHDRQAVGPALLEHELDRIDLVHRQHVGHGPMINQTIVRIQRLAVTLT